MWSSFLGDSKGIIAMSFSSHFHHFRNITSCHQNSKRVRSVIFGETPRNCDRLGIQEVKLPYTLASTE